MKRRIVLAAAAIATVTGITMLTINSAGAGTSQRKSSRSTSSPSPVSSSLAESQQGKATHYQAGGTGTGEGACMFPAGTAANKLFVALNPHDYAQAGGCGSYLDVTNSTGKSVRVLAVCLCPECKAGHIDLSKEAFSQLADLRTGIIPVTYTVVRNPPEAGPISIRVKEGSSRWWTAFLVINHGNKLATVEYQDPSGVWKSLTRSSYNHWIADKGAGPGPYTLRVTDIYGNKATMDSITLTPGVSQTTKARLY